MKSSTLTVIKTLTLASFLFGSALAFADDADYDYIGDGDYFYNDDSWAANEEYAESDYADQQIAETDDENEVSNNVQAKQKSNLVAYQEDEDY